VSIWGLGIHQRLQGVSGCDTLHEAVLDVPACLDLEVVDIIRDGGVRQGPLGFRVWDSEFRFRV